MSDPRLPRRAPRGPAETIGRDPRSWEARIRRLRRPAWLGTMRRTSPLSDSWGRDRGTPIDRWYIDRFLGANAADIRGHVIEVRDPGYTERFGHDVASIDILDIDPGNARATHIADLSAADGIPGASFDAFVLTQVLQYVPDADAALRHAARVLAPGGVLLATVPGIGRIGRHDLEIDLRRFTAPGIRRSAEAAFGPRNVEVATFGNVLAAIAFLAGMAAEELHASELLVADPAFPVLIGLRAVAPAAGAGSDDPPLRGGSG